MGKVKQFVRDYTEGLKGGEFRRLFDRDAARTYAVLSRDQVNRSEPSGRFRRFWHRSKIAFSGMSAKLTPARRALFGISLLAGLLALLQGNVNFSGTPTNSSPLFVIVAVGGLVYLLALELTDRVLIRDELEVARQLQRDLLPKTSPVIEGWRFAHSYRTANEVGGDYYDFSPLPDGRLAVLAGDASGHGMAAGLVMAIANATLKLALDLDPSPARVAQLLNRALVQTGTRQNFMSLFYGILDPASGRLDFVCAGHPFPLVRRTDGRVEELGTGAFPLGLRDLESMPEHRVELAAGEVLVTFSDGLFEATNTAGEPFGYERVTAQVAAGGSAEQVHANLLRALDRFRGDEPLVDDISLVVVERVP